MRERTRGELWVLEAVAKLALVVGVFVGGGAWASHDWVWVGVGGAALVGGLVLGAVLYWRQRGKGK